MAVEVDLGIAGVSPPLLKDALSQSVSGAFVPQKIMTVVIYVTEIGFKRS
jgi:hypothetical protein